MNLELKLYLIVMSIFCTPLFFWMVVTRNNEYRQRVLGEDPRDQVGCLRMIVVTLVRIVLAGAPPLIAGLFIAMWAEDPSGNIVFCLFSLYVVLLAAGGSKALSKFNGA